MDTTTFSLTFSIARCDPMGTLEAVLATARRGGIELVSLTFAEGSHTDTAAMRVRSDEADRLELFLLRLGNLFDVSNLVCRCSQHMHMLQES